MALVSVLERAHRAPDPLLHPPLLVVGAPRSGTSLLQQVLIAGLDIGWFSGWHNVAAGAPAALVSTRLQSGIATHFRSDHGRGRSLREPHEGATWWYRFFPRSPQAVAADDVAPRSRLALRRSMSALIQRADRPVVWKNVVNSVRLEPILAAVPEAIVIDVRRDAGDTAASILRARASETGSVDNWWSVEPRDVEALRARSPEEQVRGQIHGVRLALDAAHEAFPQVTWVDTDYETLVTAPQSVLESVAAAVERATGVDRRRPGHLVPERFSPSAAQLTS